LKTNTRFYQQSNPAHPGNNMTTCWSKDPGCLTTAAMQSSGLKPMPSSTLNSSTASSILLPSQALTGMNARGRDISEHTGWKLRARLPKPGEHARKCSPTQELQRKVVAQLLHRHWLLHYHREWSADSASTRPLANVRTHTSKRKAKTKQTTTPNQPRASRTEDAHRHTFITLLQ
jgi:hypothetical protein